MAFARNTASAPAQSNDSWKAQGFLNFFMPSKVEGKLRKLGAIPLKDSKASEAELRTWIEKNPEQVTKWLMENIVITYQSAEPNEATGFALPEFND